MNLFCVCLMMNTISPSVDDPVLSVKDIPKETQQGSEIVTLEPFLSDPLPQRGKSKKINKGNKHFKRIEILPGVFQPDNFQKYVTLKLSDERRAQELDIFEVNREISMICGREPKIEFQADGTVLIETSNQEESDKLQTLCYVNGNKAQCYPHNTLNQCRGVIRSTTLLKYSEERLQGEYASQKVTRVQQMMRKVDGALTPLPVYILTFDQLQLPQEIKAAWLHLPVRPYVPMPRRCFYCQKYGHFITSCRKKK